MAFCDVKNPPEFTTDIRKWDREMLADGNEMAVEIEQLFNNTFYNKTQNERQREKREAMLTVAGWSGGGPYTQTVAVAGISAEDEPELGKSLDGTETIEEVKAYNKAFGFIYHGETQDGAVTFQAYKKPAIDFTVVLKGA
ncbi:MAG: hypothetical protein LBQ71_12420 [Hungatella sp.]|jgi:hypothetical protein|nr:hypothetical protein [Hungatella sp.]